MRKSKLVAIILRAVCLGAAVIFVGMLLLLLFVKGPSWSKVGKVPGTNTRVDREMGDQDTSTFTDEMYYNYTHGYWDDPGRFNDPDDQEILARLAENGDMTLFYDEEGILVKIWAAPREKLGPIFPNAILSIYSGMDWCMQPAARAARYTSWMVLLLIVAVATFFPWRWAVKISEKPLKRGSGRGRSNRGSKPYRGSLFLRIKRRLSGSSRGGSRRQ